MADDKALSPGDWFFGKVLHMGANWQTTLSGVGAALMLLLTIVAALPYELGALADVFPPNVKMKLAAWAAVATTVLKIWNALAQKSRNVTGGNTQQTTTGELAKPGDQTLVDITKEAQPAK